MRGQWIPKSRLQNGSVFPQNRATTLNVIKNLHYHLPTAMSSTSRLTWQ